MVKFSIIIPAYNATPYIYELLDCLNPQITSEVEVILIDDGSKKPIKSDYKWCKVYKQKNKGISKSRNRGIECARGEVIGFIDADDLVSDKYVEFVLNALKTRDFDYIDLSWKSLEDDHFLYKLNRESDTLSNPSACTRIFKRDFIGDNRFPEGKDACEDEHFTRHLNLKNAKHIAATEYMYFYRTGTPNSNSKRFMSNLTNTKRVAYYFNQVTKDMDYLIEEFKREDETNEVILLTNKNDIPELEKYSQVICPPRHTRAIIQRGEPTKLIEIIKPPVRSQIIIWTSVTFEIGGIETFIYSFCKQMSPYYNITVMYDTIATSQLIRLMKIVRCVKNNINNPVYCDTLIINRIIDNIPSNIHYKKSVQMVHCLQNQNNSIPQKRDVIVNVSQASKDSFGEEAKEAVVIHNMTAPNGDKTKSLLLVSAIRVGAADKHGNDKRCVEFAQKLNELKIPFMWVYFGDKPMIKEPEGMCYGGMKMDIRPYLRKADYLVQLSGSEAFSYSLLESLEENTPVIVTPLDQNKDMKIVDGENAYVFPYDLSEWTDDMIKRIVQIPQFEYKHDNASIVKQWCELLGKSNSKNDYMPLTEILVTVKIEYYDLQLKKKLKAKEKIVMSYDRALELRDKGLVEILGE